MKNYSVVVTEKESKKVILDITELSNTAKYLRNKYAAKYRFNKPLCTVKVKRLIREGGIQTDLLTQIQEIENGSN